MVYYNHNGTLIYEAKDTLKIEVLTELISGNQDRIGDNYKPSGRLIYKNKKLDLRDTPV